MSDTQLLTNWMDQNGINPRMLSKAIGLDYTYVTRMLSGDRPISDTLRWRFAMTYGVSTAMRLFGDSEKELA